VAGGVSRVIAVGISWKYRVLEEGANMRVSKWDIARQLNELIL
jgi:hypothetical protein